jgi:hypothetical protein
VADEDGFMLSDFSDEEKAAMTTSRLFKANLQGPVTRRLHGRTLFCVPAGKVTSVWEDNHVNADGSHSTLTQTKLRLAHLTWPKKIGSMRELFARCETCQESRGPKGLKPIPVYTGQAGRPGEFGEVVMFDQKSMPTHSGRQYIGTCLDKTTGLFDAILISGPTGAEAIRQIKHFQRLGKTIGAAIFDRHASYLTDRAFRDFLEQQGIQPYYNKSALDADDPRLMTSTRSLGLDAFAAGFCRVDQ